VLTYSVQDGHEATQSTGGSVTKNFEQKVSVDFGEFGNAHADFKLDDTVSWDKSATDSQNDHRDALGRYRPQPDPRLGCSGGKRNSCK
jgi:hypothetical protein